MIDFGYLSRQTLGNRDLARQVLELFAVQADTLIQQLLSADRRREAAHTIIGSARAIGAFDVACIAARVEAAETLVGGDVEELVFGLEQTRKFIADYLAEKTAE
jgi:HPt (histidine-containing phosphotransfer) domain-containing protein